MREQLAHTVAEEERETLSLIDSLFIPACVVVVVDNGEAEDARGGRREEENR